MKYIATAIVIATLAVLCAFRGDDDPHQQNAALWYWRCINEINLDRESAERYVAVLSAEADPTNETEIAELIEKWDDMFDCAMIASRKPVCRFGIDRDQGLNALLPHLAPMRLLARMSRARAMHAIDRDDADLALRHLDLISRMAKHTIEDRLIISTLVATSIHSLAIDAGERLLEHDLNQQQLRQALNSLHHADVIGPACFPDVIESEREMIPQWLLKRCEADPEAAQKTLLELAGMVANVANPGAEKKAKPFAFGFQLTNEEFRKQVERLDAQYLRLVNAARADDMILFQQLQDDVMNGKHGMVARLLTPAYHKTHNALMENSTRRTNLIEKFEQRTGVDE